MKKILHNTRKKGHHKLPLRKHGNQPYIGVIETTMMYYSTENSKEHLISVFTLFVEEPSRHLILIRFYDDFKEFDKRIKSYLKRSKTTLPKLHIGEQHIHTREMTKSSVSSSINSNTSNESAHSKDHTKRFRKILHSFSQKMTQKSNSDNIERYLRHCVNDLNIRACSLFKEFLQPQRDEDNIIPKEVVHSYVQQQQLMNEEQHNNNNNTREIISNPNTTINTVTEEESMMNSPSISYTSFPSNISNNTQPPPQQQQQLQESYIDQDMNSSSISSNSPVTIQDFQLIKVIGRGCMGKVLLVRHRNSSRLLALKAISKKAVVEQRQIVHIKAEQQILSDIASIHHPFLIKLHYSFQDMNQLFLVLDYHVGGDLATQLRINHMLPPDRCRFYTAEIILGIQELHRLGILYRDLKPENILLTADGHLVLTDFGLSKQFYDGLSLEEQRADTFCGTAEYLAPEILNGLPYSYEVDYWSMGTILFEMLTGITPFWAENRDDMYRRIRSDPLQFPEFIDIETADFIARLLKRDPKKRLGSGPEGAIEVRSDPYFESINWSHIYTKRIKPPYIPNLYSDTDFSHFDSEFLRLTPRLSPVTSDYMLSQSLDQAFEGYSYINKEEVLLDSPPSELYSLNEAPPPVTLMDTNRNNIDSNNSSEAIVPRSGTRYFVYNDSDEVVPYDDYEDESNISSGDDIRPSDLIRSSSIKYRSNVSDEDDDFDYYSQLPPRPVIRHLSDSIQSIMNNEDSNFLQSQSDFNANTNINNNNNAINSTITTTTTSSSAALH